MRRIAQILKHPQTDEEERLAAEHIRAECRRIQAAWSAHERAKRQVMATERPLLREIRDARRGGRGGGKHRVARSAYARQAIPPHILVIDPGSITPLSHLVNAPKLRSRSAPA